MLGGYQCLRLATLTPFGLLELGYDWVAFQVPRSHDWGNLPARKAKALGRLRCGTRVPRRKPLPSAVGDGIDSPVSPLRRSHIVSILDTF